MYTGNKEIIIAELDGRPHEFPVSSATRAAMERSLELRGYTIKREVLSRHPYERPRRRGFSASRLTPRRSG